MKTIRHTTLTLCLLAAISCAADAAQLLPATSSDRIPPAPSASAARLLTISADLDRAPVALSWRIDPAATLAVTPAYRAQSREFWINTSGDGLRRGIEFQLTAPGAVVRISPVTADRSPAVDPERLELSRNGARISNDMALRSVIKAADLADGAVPFPEGSSAFRLAPEAGAGLFKMRAPDAGNGGYVIQVFDAQSTVSLSLQTDRDTFFAGETLQASALLAGANPLRSSGLISGPDGSTQPAALATAPDGSLRVQTPLQLPALGAARGLYELHVSTAAGSDGKLLRDVRTAFVVAAPTARLTGQLEPIAVRGSLLSWQFGIQAALAGRYQLEATLYVDGSPFATAQSAGWLEAGQRQLQLGFDTALFEGKTPARYELRDLRLVDQGQLVTLERRSLALASDSK